MSLRRLGVQVMTSLRRLRVHVMMSLKRLRMQVMTSLRMPGGAGNGGAQETSSGSDDHLPHPPTPRAPRALWRSMENCQHTHTLCC